MEKSLWRSFTSGEATGGLEWQKLRRVLHYARPFSAKIALSLIFVVIVKVLGLCTPMLIRKFMDQALPNKDSHLISLIAIGLVVVPLLRELCMTVVKYTTASVAAGLIAHLRQIMYEHYQRMSVRFFVKTRKGEIISRLGEDVATAEGAITGPMIDTWSHVVSLVVSLGAMLSIDYVLTICACLLFPVFFVPIRRMGAVAKNVQKQYQIARQNMSTLTAETLSVDGAMMTKLFGLQAANDAKYRERNDVRIESGLRSRRVSLVLNSLFAMMAAVGTALVYWYGGHAVVRGTMTAGTLIAFTTYLGQLYGPVSALLNMYTELIKSIACFDRVFDVLDLPIEIADCPDGLNIARFIADDPLRADVVFENVFFSYNESKGRSLATTERTRGPSTTTVSGAKVTSDPSTTAWGRQWALENVSLKIPAGSLCAIVGRSGSGKSSLISLIPRLYDCSQGSVSVAGVDVRNVPLDILASTISVVPQDGVLFNDTVAVNLRFAKPDASDFELNEACRVANILDLVNGLPFRFDTVLGENGHRLSGGERQRLAIARAVLRDAPILLLDEATSALDSVSEQLVQDALAPLMRGRTCIVIAHRLSTILAADMIVVIEEGRVCEVGTHTELMRAEGKYAELYHTQFRHKQLTPLLPATKILLSPSPVLSASPSSTPGGTPTLLSLVSPRDRTSSSEAGEPSMTFGSQFLSQPRPAVVGRRNRTSINLRE